MLAAVAPGAAYENLGGYRAPSAAPTAVGGSGESGLGAFGVRAPLAPPNGAVPGARAPMPTSSARPGKQTNQRIVYTRVQTDVRKPCGTFDPAPAFEGDVVFVHRGDGSVTGGRDHARPSRVASLAQLNRMLDAAHGSPQIGDTVMAPGRDPHGERGAAVDAADDPMAARWKHCEMLGRWTLDGVLASKEHDCLSEHSNPGEAFNVCVGGPTLMRNAAVGEFPQHVDDGARVLDKVFVGLVASERRGDDGKVRFYSFQYKLFSSRQLLWAELGAAGDGASRINAAAAGGDNRVGPTADEFQRMVAVWRVGSVVDSRGGTLPHKCLQMNVVVEEWTMEQVQEEYHELFGQSFVLGEGGANATAAQAVDAADVAPAATAVGEDATALGAFGGGIAALRAEVAAWEAVDRVHASDLQLAPLVGLGAGDVAPPTVRPRGVEAPPPGYAARPQGLARTVGAPLHYEPPSPALTAFWAAARATTTKDLFRDTRALTNVGRAAAFAHQPRILAQLDAARRDRVAELQSTHAGLMALRAPMRLYARLKAGAARGWPLA